MLNGYSRKCECCFVGGKWRPLDKEILFADQMRKCAVAISNTRSGSMGAKLIARFVQQQHQAARSSKLDQEEAAMYRSDGKHPSWVPIMSAVTEDDAIEAAVAAVENSQEDCLKAGIGLPNSRNRAGKRVAEALAQNGQCHKALKRVVQEAASSKETLHSLDGEAEPIQAGTGSYLHAGYVTDLLQEIATDNCKDEGTVNPSNAMKQLPCAGDSMSGPRAPGLCPRVRAPVTVPSRRIRSSETALSAAQAASKYKRAVSTERRVRQVLTEMR